jgi:hypothetical protein
MEDKLKAIVTKIEQSQLPEDQKEELYATISAGLQATVMPVLLKYMPKDQLTDLSDNPSKVTVESYTKLIEDTIKDGQALKEIAQLMDEVLQEVEKALQEEGMK